MKTANVMIIIVWTCLTAAAAFAAENFEDLIPPRPTEPIKSTEPKEAAAASAAEDPGTETKAYLIGAGDQLEVSVWKVPDLSKQLSVLPDGQIAFPLIGQIQAAGKTVAQLKKEIEARLVPFVPDPVLSVVVLQVNSLMIYVIGRVNQPGYFVLNAEIDVLQALSMAGGLNSFAKSGDIKILRKSMGGRKIFKFDYDEVSSGRNMTQNIILKRGDVVVVR